MTSKKNTAEKYFDYFAIMTVFIIFSITAMSTLIGAIATANIWLIILTIFFFLMAVHKIRYIDDEKICTLSFLVLKKDVYLSDINDISLSVRINGRMPNIYLVFKQDTSSDNKTNKDITIRLTQKLYDHIKKYYPGDIKNEDQIAECLALHKKALANNSKPFYAFVEENDLWKRRF